jgi:hypothetical protein
MQRFILPTLFFASTIAAFGALRTYTPTSSTLHLWHLDESGTPVVDAGTNPLDLPVLSGGATLGNPSFAGFGTALSTFDSGLSGSPASLDAYLSALPLVNGVGDETTLAYSNATTGAFTFEAMIRLDVDLTQTFTGSARGVTPMHIFSGEGEASPDRIWQFRLDPIGFNPNADGVTAPLTGPALEFINVHGAIAPVQNRVVPLPLTGPNAVAMGAWYHVAVSYDGNDATADNLSIFWTKVDSSRTAADLLIRRQLDTDLPIAAVDFAIGNIGRVTPNGNFLGLIDEIRISDTALGAGNFIFIPEPSTGLLASMGCGILFLRRRRDGGTLTMDNRAAKRFPPRA